LKIKLGETGGNHREDSRKKEEADVVHEDGRKKGPAAHRVTGGHRGPARRETGWGEHRKGGTEKTQSAIGGKKGRARREQNIQTRKSSALEAKGGKGKTYGAGPGGKREKGQHPEINATGPGEGGVCTARERDGRPVPKKEVSRGEKYVGRKVWARGLAKPTKTRQKFFRTGKKKAQGGKI